MKHYKESHKEKLIETSVSAKMSLEAQGFASRKKEI
jgi:hypothetical protein